MDEGYIKLCRKLAAWEWYTDANTARVFIHCLIMANWQDTRYRGTVIPRGSFMTGRAKLAQELKISERSVRTAFEHLISTNEITIKSSPQGSIITVVNYDRYQANDQQTDQRPTNDRPTTDQRPTSNKNIKNIKNIKNNNIKGSGEPVEFKRYSEDEELDGAIRDFIKHRKALRKPMTERAVDLFLKKLRQISTDKAGQIEAINEAIERGWLSVYPPNVNYGSSRSQKTPNGFESSSSSSEDLRELEAMLINQSRKEG